MKLILEELEYQKQAIASVINVFDGQEKNTFENSFFFEIKSNVSSLTPEEIAANKQRVIAENSLDPAVCNLTEDNDYCVEMETGTGKTLVYIRTIYELFKHYGLTKFMIIVPSIAIKEGVLTTLETFEDQLTTLYGHKLPYFEYDSKKLSRLKHFISDTQPQIMVMTIQSFTADDRIINQEGRDDAFLGMSYIKALGKCQPVIIMDEPQEGMDTDNAISRFADLNPLCKIRYSATHKSLKNLMYRLTPYDAYQQGLVKKIEVLSVAEKNDEATLKIEITQTQTASGQQPKVKLNLWRKKADSFEWKESAWLKAGDNLAEKSGNVSYHEYTIERIYKGLRDPRFHVTFTNGIELTENERTADFEGLFRQQIYWLLDSHYKKKAELAAQGIKCLSLIFIDKVDSYVRDNGVIKRLFNEEYASAYKERHKEDATPEQITAAQGYYFARATSGEYTDNENSMLKNKDIFDTILRDKGKLLNLDNPIEFIFTHSALGVGWDNPNIFCIATLNQSFSEIKKRQEIGRGLRICVNQLGHRIYDLEGTEEGKEINLLTVVPNETYETFVTQYQEQIREVYGDTAAGSTLRKNHKGKQKKEIIKRNKKNFESAAFQAFWRKLRRKTDYTVDFHQEAIVARAIEAINKIRLEEYQVQVVLTRIKGIYKDSLDDEELGRETEKLKASFAPLDLVEELSENTGLSYATTLEIVAGLTNHAEIVKNPPRFIQEACALIRNIEMDEMLRGLTYHDAGPGPDLSLFKETIETFLPTRATPNRGVYDKIICDSNSRPEREFALNADSDNEVVCFLKLPDFYEIPIPVGKHGTGKYRPDFGLVLKRKSLKSGDESDYYFVIETKSTANLDDMTALTDSERYKIKCAQKHFASLGIPTEIAYVAPVAEYHRDFKNKVK
jgi:type III restriction enzyme